MARLRAPAVAGGAIAALAALLWLAIGHGFANYDALYSLVWGRDLAHGRQPDFDVFLAPTPHPLSNVVGAALSPLGAGGAEDALVVIAFLALAAVGLVVVALGREWFGWPVGLLAAAIVLTREPIVSTGARAYVDLPYLALVLAALLVEARRPRAGWPVLALLGLAGLIRPEAWLFAGAYVLWLRRWELLPLAAAAPVLWLLSDLAITGDALHSLTGTKENVETLGRKTGIANVPQYVPRRLGEVLREPVLVAAVGGVALTWWRVRERARLGVAAAALALIAFVALAIAGLPIIARYTFGLAALASVFAAAGVLGWLTLAREDEWRARWMAFGALAAVLLLAFLPSQAGRLDRTRDAIAAQQQIRDDLHALLDAGPVERPVGVVNHRLVPTVALHLDIAPRQAAPAPLPPGVMDAIWPADATVARRYVLDPRDPSQRLPAAPRGFERVRGNASWDLLRRAP